MSCRRHVVVAFAVALGFLALQVRAQHHGDNGHTSSEARDRVDAFVAEIRHATERYADIETAIADGYRLFGPDMPGMGEHWVSPSLAVSRDFDPLLPPVLTYLQVEGVRQLTGVAYTFPVGPGEAPPELPFDGEWHFHAGDLEDEAYGVHRSRADDRSATRLAMIHAWVWAGNPAGPFAADNWALSFLKLGLEVPPVVVADAARMLFAVADGTEYYVEFARRASDGLADVSVVRDVITTHVEEVRALLDGLNERGSVTPSEQEVLARTWRAMWDVMMARLDAEAAAGIAFHLQPHH